MNRIKTVFRQNWETILMAACLAGSSAIAGALFARGDMIGWALIPGVLALILLAGLDADIKYLEGNLDAQMEELRVSLGREGIYTPEDFVARFGPQDPEWMEFLEEEVF
jgi:hypothetical protein